ncbi:hypothetical protein GW17_00054399 [Ensete ventricosum]|nr:hypothetical protein GW17_00054399 [Ensete ventricosum]
MRALRSQLVVTLPLRLLLQVPGLLQMVHCPHPPLVKSQGAGPFCSDILGSMLSKASNFALIASYDAIVYASRFVILRGREENRRWWLKLQAFNHESDTELVMSLSHQNFF